MSESWINYIDMMKDTKAVTTTVGFIGEIPYIFVRAGAGNKEIQDVHLFQEWGNPSDYEHERLSTDT